jgi:hypothetical protein
MKSYVTLAAICFFFAVHCFAQQSQTQTQSQPAIPSTDIYLAGLKMDAGAIHIEKPVNVTHRKGYDNQPYFLPDGQAFFYTVIGEDEQADSYRYDLKTGASKALFHTKDSEYSPTLTPDGKHISVVRVEADQTQRLWMFPLAGGEPELVLPNVKPVGYHVWVDDHTLVLFILGEPNTLQSADTKTGKTQVIADKIGRCIRNIPKTNKVSFARNTEGKNWNIEEWDPQTNTTKVLTTAVSDEADYAWLPDGSLLMAADSKLLRWDPAKGSGWTEVADFSKDGLHGITRMLVDPAGDRLAIVAEE